MRTTGEWASAHGFAGCAALAMWTTLRAAVEALEWLLEGHAAGRASSN